MADDVKQTMPYLAQTNNILQNFILLSLSVHSVVTSFLSS